MRLVGVLLVLQAHQARPNGYDSDDSGLEGDWRDSLKRPANGDSEYEPPSKIRGVAAASEEVGPFQVYSSKSPSGGDLNSETSTKLVQGVTGNPEDEDMGPSQKVNLKPLKRPRADELNPEHPTKAQGEVADPEVMEPTQKRLREGESAYEPSTKLHETESDPEAMGSSTVEIFAVRNFAVR